jgi:hypothetical protein
VENEDKNKDQQIKDHYIVAMPWLAHLGKSIPSIEETTVNVHLDPEKEKESQKIKALARVRAKYPSLEIENNIFDEFKPKDESIRARYYHVPIDFCSKEGRTLMMREINRIIKN